MEIIPKRTKIVIAVITIVVIVGLAGVLFYVIKSPPGANRVAGGPQRKNVTILNYTYSPAIVTVRYGDTVVWRNASAIPHTVTFRTLSKTLQPGEAWEWVITPDYFLKGSNMYWCDFHANQGMQGARVVVE